MADFFENLREKVQALVEDIKTLDVVTYTGEIKVTGGKKDDGSLDITKLYHELVNATQPGAAGGATAAAPDLKVVAFTHIDFDRDTAQFVKSALTPGEEKLLETHKDMVKASREARQAVVKMAAEIFHPGK